MTQTAAGITRKLYGEVFSVLLDPTQQRIWRCGHLRSTPSVAAWLCVLHPKVGAMCGPCFGEHGWAHRGRSCDSCLAPEAPHEALPFRFTPALDPDLAALLEQLPPMVAEALTPGLWLAGPSLCRECRAVFDRAAD